MQITLSYNDQSVELTPGKYASFNELYIDSSFENLSDLAEITGRRLKLSIHPKENITLNSLHIKLSTEQSIQSFVVNPFHTGLLNSSDNVIAKNFLPTSIDYSSNHNYSWGYSYAKRSSSPIFFIGSLSENTGLTLIRHHSSDNSFSVFAECENLALEHSFPAVDLLILEGDEEKVLDYFFNAQQQFKMQEKSIAILVDDEKINSTDWDFSKSEIGNVILEHNYCKSIGDWLQIKKEYQQLLKKTKAANKKVALSIAPFLCESDSDVYKRKKHWLLKNKKGKLVNITSTHDRKMLFVLDFYQKEVQDYLNGVLFSLLNKWNVNQIFLSEIYAVSIEARKNKTRGQILSDALQFLKENIGSERMILSEVPLLSTLNVTRRLQLSSIPPLSNWKNFFSIFSDAVHQRKVDQFKKIIFDNKSWGSYFQLYSSPIDFINSDNKLEYNYQYSLLIFNSLQTDHLIIRNEIENEILLELQQLQQAVVLKAVFHEPVPYRRGRSGSEKHYCQLPIRKHSLRSPF